MTAPFIASRWTAPLALACGVVVILGVALLLPVLAPTSATADVASEGAACCENAGTGATSPGVAPGETPSLWAGIASVGAAPAFLARLFDTSDYPRRWNCGTWTAGHGWLHIVSDLAVWGAYMAIPIALAVFIRGRRDAPFPFVFWLFIAFIAACGIGHLCESLLFFWPAYRLSGLIKLATAIISWATVCSLIPIIPKALTLPGLANLNAELRHEVQRREQVEQGLRQRADELEKANHELEQFHTVTIDREQRVVDLKRQVNELAAIAGHEAPYDLSFLEQVSGPGDATEQDQGR